MNPITTETQPSLTSPGRCQRIATALLAAALLLGACATTRHYEQFTEAARLHAVDQHIVSKLAAGERLNLDDIVGLSEKAYPPDTLIAYLRLQGGVYHLKSEDVSRLRKAGVSSTVIDYLLETAKARFREGANSYRYYDPWYWPHYPDYHYHHHYYNSPPPRRGRSGIVIGPIP